MKNIKTFRNTVAALLNIYENTTAADFVRYGFEFNGKIYEIFFKRLPEWLVRMDTESTGHGGAEKIRIADTVENKRKLVKLGAIAIGTAEELFDFTIANKGHRYEKYCTEQAGQEWKRDRIEYYIDGDLTVNQIKYQIKFGDASLANENTIRKALAYKGM